MYCDRCGQNFQAKQGVCSHCNVAATKHWFQLMSLVTLLLAVLSNTLIGVLLLPRLVATQSPRFVFRAWLWFDHKAAFYGWAVIALGLLAWDFLVWKKGKPKVKGWFTRKLLTFSLAAGLAPMLPWWVPAGQPPKEFLSKLEKYPGGPLLLAWGIVLLVIVLLCVHAETRDRLLGHGRTLSLISVGLLVLVMSMTIVGWSLTR